jgi:hypothetical protein
VKAEGALHGLEGATTTIHIQTIMIKGIKSNSFEQKRYKPHSHCRQCLSLCPQWSTQRPPAGRPRKATGTGFPRNRGDWVNGNEISIIVLIASIDKCGWTGGLCARLVNITGLNARAACSVKNAEVLMMTARASPAEPALKWIRLICPAFSRGDVGRGGLTLNTGVAGATVDVEEHHTRTTSPKPTTKRCSLSRRSLRSFRAFHQSSQTAIRIRIPHIT